MNQNDIDRLASAINTLGAEERYDVISALRIEFPDHFWFTDEDGFLNNPRAGQAFERSPTYRFRGVDVEVR